MVSSSHCFVIFPYFKKKKSEYISLKMCVFFGLCVTAIYIRNLGFGTLYFQGKLSVITELLNRDTQVRQG